MILVVFGVALGATAGAQTVVTPRALNGEWTGTLALDNSSPRIAAVFETTDSTFAGKVYTDGMLFGDMREGSISGSKVHFKVDRLDFTGSVAGTRMTVDLIVYNGSTRKLTLVKTPPMKPDTTDVVARRAREP